ncbi:hypothetical protein AAG906_006760 [Vitis piasezkii]
MEGMLFDQLEKLAALEISEGTPSRRLRQLHGHGREHGRPWMRAWRGQVTDPHGVVERLHRERIAGRVKALQEFVPASTRRVRLQCLMKLWIVWSQA